MRMYVVNVATVKFFSTDFLVSAIRSITIINYNPRNGQCPRSSIYTGCLVNSFSKPKQTKGLPCDTRRRFWNQIGLLSNSMTQCMVFDCKTRILCWRMNFSSCRYYNLPATADERPETWTFTKQGPWSNKIGPTSGVCYVQRWWIELYISWVRSTTLALKIPVQNVVFLHENKK
jgi:hypothetical protein